MPPSPVLTTSSALLTMTARRIVASQPNLRRRARIVVLPALFATLATLPALAAVDHREGTAYARDDGRVLYRESHYTWTDGAHRRRLVLYRCPGGDVFARKTVDYTPSPTAPDFSFEDGRDGYREGVRRVDGGREVFVRESRDAAEQRRVLVPPDGAVIDAGFDESVRMRWDALAANGVRVPFLVPSRFAFYDMRIDTDAAPAGDVRRLRLQLDRWFGFLVDPIDLAYANDDRRLLEFSGVTGIRDPRGRPLEARIDFPQPAEPIDAGERDRAARLPLVRACADA